MNVSDCKVGNNWGQVKLILNAKSALKLGVVRLLPRDAGALH